MNQLAADWFISFMRNEIAACLRNKTYSAICLGFSQQIYQFETYRSGVFFEHRRFLMSSFLVPHNYL